MFPCDISKKMMSINRSVIQYIRRKLRLDYYNDFHLVRYYQVRLSIDFLTHTAKMLRIICVFWLARWLHGAEKVWRYGEVKSKMVDKIIHYQIKSHWQYGNKDCHLRQRMGDNNVWLRQERSKQSRSWGHGKGIIGSSSSCSHLMPPNVSQLLIGAVRRPRRRRGGLCN